MPDGTVQVGDKKIDNSELTVSQLTVERQRVVSADPTDALAVAAVTSSAPPTNTYGLVTRGVPSMTDISGNDLLREQVIELRIMNQILVEALLPGFDLDAMRAHLYFTSSVT